jgi:hypothetical protein
MLAVVTAAAAIFVSGAALGQGAGQRGIQSERQKVAGFIQLLKDDRADERADRNSINKRFQSMLEALRANKGITEDQAKRAQALLQQMKDASSQTSDFIGSFLDLMRSISQKIQR